MSVKMKKSDFIKTIDSILFEDGYVPYGIYDRPGPKSHDDPTIPNEVPLDADQTADIQLTVDVPPVDDNDYVPANSKELSRAAAQLVSSVPDDLIEKTYHEIKALTDAIVTSPVEVHNEATRWGDIKLGKHYDKEEEEELESEEFEPEPDDDEILQDLADEFGYKGASGIRQEMGKILKRSRYLVEKLPENELEKFKDFAVQEFTRALVDGEYIEEDEANVMVQNPSFVKGTDSFRFYFMGSFFIPAYRALVRDSKKRMTTILQGLKIPEKAHAKIIDQVVGNVSKDDSIIEKAIRLADKKANVNALMAALQDAGPDLEAASKLGDDLVEKSIERWYSMPNSKKQQALEQALKSTISMEE